MRNKTERLLRNYRAVRGRHPSAITSRCLTRINLTLLHNLFSPHRSQPLTGNSLIRFVAA